MSRRISYTQGCRRAIGQLSKKDRSVAATIDQELKRLSRQRPPTRGRLRGLGGRPVFKVRFRIGARRAGRLIVLVDRERVVGIVVYAKNQTENLTAKEIERFLDELEDEGDATARRS